MNKFYLALFSLLFFIQTDAQLLNEIGVTLGGTNYSGDIGRELYIFPNRVGGGIVYKRNVNSRLVGRISLSYLPIADDDQYSSNIVRQTRGPNGTGYSFTNTLYEAAFGIEFNYFDYDVMSKYKGYTPYIFVEFAGVYYDIASAPMSGADDNEINYSNKVAYAIPFGLGYKSRITDSLGYSLELRAQYTFEDDLDLINSENDTSDISIGNPRTTDWYFFTGVSLTYSFGRPPCFSPRP